MRHTCERSPYGPCRLQFRLAPSLDCCGFVQGPYRFPSGTDPERTRSAVNLSNSLTCGAHREATRSLQYSQQAREFWRLAVMASSPGARADYEQAAICYEQLAHAEVTLTNAVQAKKAK